jgi:hypothetical protein
MGIDGDYGLQFLGRISQLYSAEPLLMIPFELFVTQ